MNTEMIEKLKQNWTAWGGLGEEEREFLKDHWKDVEWNEESWRKVIKVDARQMHIKLCDVYRLAPDFKEPEKEGRFVEYPIAVHQHRTFGYKCCVKHIHNSEVAIHKLPSIVGFAGVQFDGQLTDHWYGFVVAGIDGRGDINPSFFRDQQKPATPVRARFWAEG